ncbi:MAG: MgtC/SapB family protein [Telmatospirillum sp.]|nr:MgtC/SapB family protein [Telmatospirillum sp.]
MLHLSDPEQLLATVIALTVAFVLGTLIGLERQYRQRTAGLRTNVLVAVGAAAFADIGLHLQGGEGAVRIVSYIVSGIGFLGAGAIMKEGAHVRGLNTAATLWCSAAVGACSGAGFPVEAVLLTVFVLAGNTLLRPLVNHINRKPMDERVTEASYRVHVVCDPSRVADVRELLFDELEAAHYPIREIEVLAEGEDEVELAAVLVPTTAEPGELDVVVAALEHRPEVINAAWTVSTTS